ncbi:hypothetical protein GCM10010532_102650 [Dactylosporangium siamense]
MEKPSQTLHSGHNGQSTSGIPGGAPVPDVAVIGGTSGAGTARTVVDATSATSTTAISARRVQAPADNNLSSSFTVIPVN